jgi:drug/metabolite transporter (DMT)-like permease
MSSRTKAYLSMTLVSLIWGIAVPIIKVTLNYLPPLTFLFYRFVLVGILIFPFYIQQLKKHSISLKDLIPLSGIGLLATTVYLAPLYLGLDRTTAIDGSVLSSITPLFIIGAGYLFLKEQITKYELFGIIFVVIGSIITILQPIIEDGALALSNSFGNILIITASIIWAFFVLWSKKSFSRFPPLLITLHGSIVALITFFPLALLETNFSLPNYKLLITNYALLGSMFYMVVISYVLAYFLYSYGMSKIEISEASLFTYLQPLFAAPIAVVFLKESLTPTFLLGAGFIFFGIFLAEFLAHSKGKPIH